VAEEGLRLAEQDLSESRAAALTTPAVALGRLGRLAVAAATRLTAGAIVMGLVGLPLGRPPVVAHETCSNQLSLDHAAAQSKYIV